jgi:hypothetical protein
MTIKSRRRKWAEQVGGVDRMAVAYKILARKRKGGIPLERYRRRW